MLKCCVYDFGLRLYHEARSPQNNPGTGFPVTVLLMFSGAYRCRGRGCTIPSVMLSLESASDWLEPARQNAARFAGLLKADKADLRENQATPEAAGAVAKIQQIQCLLGRIIAGLNDDAQHVPEQEINRT